MTRAGVSGWWMITSGPFHWVPKAHDGLPAGKPARNCWTDQYTLVCVQARVTVADTGCPGSHTVRKLTVVGAWSWLGVLCVSLPARARRSCSPAQVLLLQLHQHLTAAACALVDSSAVNVVGQL